MSPLKILVLASEVAPFTKTGGLADVTGSLPKALAALGHDVRIVAPGFETIEVAARDGRFGLSARDLTLQVPIGTGLTYPDPR